MQRTEMPARAVMLPHMEALLVAAHDTIRTVLPDVCDARDCVAHVGALLLSTLMLLGERSNRSEQIMHASMIAIRAYLGHDAATRDTVASCDTVDAPRDNLEVS